MSMDGTQTTALMNSLADLLSLDPMNNKGKRKEVIEKLPAVTEEDLTRLEEKESCCPICLVPFLAVLASEEMAQAMDSPATAAEDLGVIRLADTCGHIFCRKDITMWIWENDSCPTCRRPFIISSDSDQSNDNTPVPVPAIAYLTGTIGELEHVPNESSVGEEEHEGNLDDSHEGRDEFVGLYS